MTTELLFDYLGVRIIGLRAAERSWAIDVVVTDRSERWRVGVERGALHATRTADGESAATAAEVTIELAHAQLAALVFAQQSLDELEAAGAEVRGDRAAIVELVEVLDRFSLWFPIVTP
jgi:alkyl sulfatase BDS1-like metallo-beta-lactamase superfamily hydrolase